MSRDVPREGRRAEVDPAHCCERCAFGSGEHTCGLDGRTWTRELADDFAARVDTDASLYGKVYLLNGVVDCPDRIDYEREMVKAGQLLVAGVVYRGRDL